ncbi:hypothetical protein AK830_g9064 [Neonectria ditissima]|uniref:Xylanolytic transcriptional activator regulatory domain-containing protein n=1 Tax=Neonectria ditissima TaxID=78410 RepID=A0A0P7AJ73_9HYPO|nr:hypothetical protein AK830_g9064 [Neonectria ditissima]
MIPAKSFEETSHQEMSVDAEPHSSSWPPRERRPSTTSLPGGIRRIRQACTNCRYRKTKCSGDRPKSPAWSNVGKARAIEQDQNNRVAPCSAEWQRATKYRVRIPPSLYPPSPRDPDKCTSSPTLKETPSPDSSSMTFNDQDAFLNDFIAESPSSQFRIPSEAESISKTPNVPRFNTIPSHSVTQSLVDSFFVHVHNQPYSYFHEQSFRDRLACGLLPKCLVFAVLASALRFSDIESFRGSVHEATEAYAREAWLSILSDHMTAENSLNLYVAQATNMLAIIDFTAAGRTSSGWLKIGLAVRISQDLQLMEEPNSDLPAVEQEERRRAFWSVYLLDKLVSCGQGRPPAISDDDCHLSLPCHEQIFRDGGVADTPTLHKLLKWNTELESRCGTFSLAILAASALGRCARYVLHQRDIDEILPWDSQSNFASLNSSFLLVEHHLQSENRPVNEIVAQHRQPDGNIDHGTVGWIVFARNIFHLCHCLLNHPFLVRLRLQKLKCRMPPNFWAQALQSCRTHACKLVDLLDTAASAGCHVQSSFYAYSVAVAGSILSLSICADREMGKEVDPAMITGSQQALNTLESMGRVWEHASKMHLQLLLFDAQRLALAQSLDPQLRNDIDPKLELTFWSMVNYDKMCNSLSAIETILDSEVLDNCVPVSLDFNIGLKRDCKDLDTVRCDTCRRDELLWKSELPSQGIVASHAGGRRDALALERFEAALGEIEELGKMGCRICWMFDGVKEAGHQWGTCGTTTEKDLSFSSGMDFQGLVNYKKDPQARFLSCFYCHVSQELYQVGYETKGVSCRWKHAVIPMALAAGTEADIWSQVRDAAGRDFKGRDDYADWLGRKHSKL